MSNFGELDLQVLYTEQAIALAVDHFARRFAAGRKK
jgi:hypothetical protein